MVIVISIHAYNCRFLCSGCRSLAILRFMREKNEHVIYSPVKWVGLHGAANQCLSPEANLVQTSVRMLHCDRLG